VVRTICASAAGQEDKGEGAVLIFLPGAPEIKHAEWRLRDLPTLHVVPLHGQLTPKEQQRAFAPPPRGARKVVLATNVAETSLTIPDIVYVVDTGRVKRLTHDPATHLSALREGWCSQASAAQRRGRAGRVKSTPLFLSAP
jgi:HrpA-like RNA helicase